MKKLSLFVGLLAAAIIVFGQKSANRTLPSFDRVQSAEGVEVFLSKGNEHTARIEAEGITVEDVITEVSGDKLQIHLEGTNHRNVEVKVYVTYVTLSGVSASSASNIRVDGEVKASGDFEVSASSAGSVSVNVSARSVDLDVSSSGNINIGVNAEELDAEMSSAGDITISGNVRAVAIDGSSSGQFDGDDFTCEVADLRVSSGASIRITVTKELEGRASSGGSIRYKGNPGMVDANSSSGGSVKKG